MNEEQIKAFLIELTALSHKHGIHIHGCGCCGSPSLHPVRADTEANAFYIVENNEDDLEWVTKIPPDPGEFITGKEV